MQDIEASQNEDARYRLLVDAIVDYAIYMLDPDGRITSWNSGAQRFKGYTASEIIGDHFSRFYTDEDRAAGAPARALATAVREGRYETEGWRVRKGGERFWAHVLIDPIRSPSGELLGFAKITRDLTERQQAAEILRRNQEQFRLLVEGVTDYAIYMLDPEGRVTNWNAGAQRIKGYAPAEIIGRNFACFYTDSDQEAGLPAKVLRVAETEGRFESEGWRVRKDGTQFWAHVVIDPIRNDAGEAIGFAKITRDITERRDAEIKLQQAQQALFQSQKLEAIGQLTGGVAHDFNNLLMAIVGSLELLRKRLPSDPKAGALLDNAMLGAQRGAALTQRMLAFARKQDLNLEPVDVSDLVAGMSGLLERALGPSIQLEMRISDALPPATSDANQLEAALLNLAVNARDAMGGEGRIFIEARHEILEAESAVGLPPGGYLRLAVIDTGGGMDEQTLARATEPFYTTKGVGKGTGLGLPMVHGLAEQSGGRLFLHSRPGHGTRAEVWLPESSGAVAPAPPPRIPVPQEDDGRPLVVLAVDDDRLVLTNTAAIIEDLGHEVRAAVSAAEALTILAMGGIDMVITDHAMPQMTGLQLAEAIAKLRPGLPVILATGYAELPPAAAGDLPRLAKPYSQAELAELIRRVRRRCVLQASPTRSAAGTAFERASA